MRRLVVIGMLGALAAVAWDRGTSPEKFTNVPVEFRHKPKEYGKTPVYFDCAQDGLTIQPGAIGVTDFSLLSLSDTNNPVRQTLDYIEASKDKMFLMVLQRPHSAPTFEAVCRTFYLRGIEVAQELVDKGVSVEDAIRRPDFTLGPLARPLERKPVMFECRNNELFYVSNYELARKADQFLDRYRPLARREDIEMAEQAMRQNQFADEHYMLDSQAFIMGKTRLRARPGVQGAPVASLANTEGLFLKRLRMFDPGRLYVQFLVRDDSFELVRQARLVAEEQGFEWRVRVLKKDEALEF